MNNIEPLDASMIELRQLQLLGTQLALDANKKTKRNKGSKKKKNEAREDETGHKAVL